ncbi:MAG: TolC family outer membrane protein [Pseudomonadota bacterium]
MTAIRSRSAALAFAATLMVAQAPLDAAAQSLADSLVTAYRNSPDLASADASLKIASENAVQARSGNRPTVSAALGLDLQYDNFNTLEFPTDVSLTITQALYTGGQVENATAAAETRITAQEATNKSTEQSVLLGAVTAHEDVLRDAQFVQLGIKNLRVLSEQLRAARERFEVGEVTRTDVEQARAAVAASRSSLAAARGALASSREAYLRAVGVRPGDLQPQPPLPEIPATIEEAVAIALVNDPALIAARLEREASGFDVRTAIGALLPQVDLVASASRFDTIRDSADAEENATIGLNVTIPFYTGGFNYSNIREAQANVEGDEANIVSAERTAVENVGTAYASLNVARASIEAGKLEVEAAQLAFEGVREEAKVGARTTLDVLDAEADVISAESDLVSRRRDEVVAVYSILASIGMLTIEHLGLDVGGGAAESYYETVRTRNFGYDVSEDTVWRKEWRP